MVRGDGRGAGEVRRGTGAFHPSLMASWCSLEVVESIPRRPLMFCDSAPDWLRCQAIEGWETGLPIAGARLGHKHTTLCPVISLTAVQTEIAYPTFDTTWGIAEMESEQWARLCKDKACGLRRGAWYRVVRGEPDGVVLALGRDEITVSRDLLEFVSTRPVKWTVVERSRRSISLLARWGMRYAVCPSCRLRQVPTGQPTTLRCGRCNELFEVAWDEPFIVGDSGS